jgi:GntR family transcriptional repressor for pyruvate dehydrogenase complex
MDDELATLSTVIERVLGDVVAAPGEVDPATRSALEEVRGSVARMEALLAQRLESAPSAATTPTTPAARPAPSRAARPKAGGVAAPVGFQRRSEGVLNALETMIVSGEVQPGDRLPPERELAERFGVGRNSVREAIRQLSLLGLVEAYQGGGTFVAETTSASLIRPFLNVVQFGGATADKIMEFRIVFEPAVAALAAMRAGPDDLVGLEAALEAFEVAIADGRDDAAECDTRFHHLVAASTGNPVFAAIESALMEFLHAFRQQALVRAAYNPGDGAVNGHRDVYERIAAADGHGAADAMRAHLLASRAHVIADVDVTPAADR